MSTSLLVDDFKQAMRRLATTVGIVTAGYGSERTGMAATAIMSVTVDPPAIAVAVNRNASLSPLLARDSRFCVNLLSERHRDLVRIFSGEKKGLERFSTGDWQLGDERPALLNDAVASLMCRVIGSLEVGTHTLFIGQVEEIINHPMIDPLIWADGRFAGAREIL